MVTPRRIILVIFWAIAIYALSLKVPMVLSHFKHQDQKAPSFSISYLNKPGQSERFELQAQSRKLVVVFWATWCGPCEVELKRINELILEKKIQPSDILAISIQEEESVVRAIVKKNNYQFNVAVDRDGSISRQYQVSATPTVVFIDENLVINWMTAGMSPTLVFRITSFLK